MARRKPKQYTTPATVALRDAAIAFEMLGYDHDPNTGSYGHEAAEALGLDTSVVFKTLVVRTDSGRFGVCVLPVSHSADLKAVASAMGDKKATLAAPEDVHRLTGYVLGGVSPIGQRTALPTVVDTSAQHLETVYVSGGHRGFDLALAPQDLLHITGGSYAAVARG